MCTPSSFSSSSSSSSRRTKVSISFTDQYGSYPKIVLSTSKIKTKPSFTGRKIKNQIPTRENTVILIQVKGQVRKKMPLANSNDPSRVNWFLIGLPLEHQGRLVQDDINHEPNICLTRGITRMPASALGCLCLMQVYGESLNPLNKERRAGKEGCFPLQKWCRAFHGSPYLSLTTMMERDALEFWREFSASSLWEDMWKPWTESLNNDDIRARCYYMKWLPTVDYRLKVKWGNAFGDFFRFRNGPFGFEIIEVLNRPDWLDVEGTTDPSSSEESETGETRRGDMVSIPGRDCRIL